MVHLSLLFGHSCRMRSDSRWIVHLLLGGQVDSPQTVKHKLKCERRMSMRAMKMVDATLLLRAIG